MPPRKRPAKTSSAARARPTERARPTKGARPKATKSGRPKARTGGRPTTVAIVGAGRLGSALALALDSCGYRISALVARSRASAGRAARTLTNSAPLALSALELDSLPDSDILIIATPDDQIEATAARLGDALDEAAAARRSAAGVEANARASSHPSSPSSSRARRASRVALHASGALSSESLAALRGRGFAVGSLHPLVSVSDAKTALDNLRGAFYCVEGDPPAARIARRVVRSLGGQSFSIKARDKALYHASAVLAAGHAVALFDLATESLAACGLTRARARAVLLPLARSAVANLAASPTNAAALTGPFARADAETVRRNLSALAARGLVVAQAAYVLLGHASLDLAGWGADPASRAEMARALAGGGAVEDGDEDGREDDEAATTPPLIN